MPNKKKRYCTWYQGDPVKADELMRNLHDTITEYIGEQPELDEDSGGVTALIALIGLTSHVAAGGEDTEAVKLIARDIRDSITRHAYRTMGNRN